jgi:hypothetical protein
MSPNAVPPLNPLLRALRRAIAAPGDRWRDRAYRTGRRGHRFQDWCRARSRQELEAYPPATQVALRELYDRLSNYDLKFYDRAQMLMLIDSLLVAPASPCLDERDLTDTERAIVAVLRAADPDALQARGIVYRLESDHGIVIEQGQVRRLLQLASPLRAGDWVIHVNGAGYRPGPTARA